MNTDSNCRKCSTGLSVLAILCSFLVVGCLVWLMRSYTTPLPLFQIRSAERMKIKAEFDALNNPIITGYDWADKSKGIIRIPVAEAKELVLKEWANPAAGRTTLTNRAAKAFAPAAVAKNPFE